MKPASRLPRMSLVLLASLGAGTGSGYLLGRGDSHEARLREIRRAARAADVNEKLICALVDVTRDRHMGLKPRGADLAEHYRLCARDLYGYGRTLGWMPGLSVAALVTDGGFVPFALANSHLPEEEIVLSASPEELARFVRECLRRWSELEGRARRR